MRALLVLVVLAAGCVAPSPPPDAGTASDSATPAIVVGAIGNSLMLGYNADADHIEAAPEIAWATGVEPWSFQARAGAAAVENVAAPGAPASAFVDQADALEHATLVLVLLPADGLCPGPPRDAPPFEESLRDGIRLVHERGMQAMLLTSPDLRSIAAAARAKPPLNDFVLFFANAQACAQDPGLPARQAAMWETIGRVADEEGALHDHGAISRIEWAPDMVSDLDGFHPSPVGLEAIAEAVWDAYEAVR